MINIDVISDTVCPWCFIGKRKLELALSRRQIFEYQIYWRPFQLNPEMPEAGMEREQYLEMKFGSIERGLRAQQTMREAGMNVGLDFRFDLMERQPNTLKSHKLIRWAFAANCQDKVVELLFQRYFLAGHDIGDDQILIDIAQTVGMDGELVREQLLDDTDQELLRQEENIARKTGITNVPCFIINEQYAVSGAQNPSVLVTIFDLASKEEAPLNKPHAETIKSKLNGRLL